MLSGCPKPIGEIDGHQRTGSGVTAEIILFVPRPNPDRERKLAEEAAKILTPFVETTGFTDTSPCEMIPYAGTGIDGIWTDTDPA